MSALTFSELIYNNKPFDKETHKYLTTANDGSFQLKTSWSFLGCRSIHAAVDKNGTISPIPSTFFSNFMRRFRVQQDPNLIEVHKKLSNFEEVIRQYETSVLPVMDQYRKEYPDASQEERLQKRNSLLKEKFNETLLKGYREMFAWGKEIHARGFAGLDNLRANFNTLNDCFKKADRHEKSYWVTMLKAISYVCSIFYGKKLPFHIFKPLDMGLFENYIFKPAMQVYEIESQRPEFVKLGIKYKNFKMKGLPTKADLLQLPLKLSKECRFTIDGQECSLEHNPQNQTFNFFYHNGPLEQPPKDARSNYIYGNPLIIKEKSPRNFGTMHYIQFLRKKVSSIFPKYGAPIAGCLQMCPGRDYKIYFSNGKRMTISL